jgi:hypothetical protein
MACADDGDADQLSVGPEAESVSLGRLVEVDGGRRVADVQVENVPLRVVVDPVEGALADGDAHGVLRRARAVTMVPEP